MRTTLRLLLLAALLLPWRPAAAEDVLAKIEQPGELIAGTAFRFTPFVFLQGEQPVGFDLDLINKIAADWGVKVEVTEIAMRISRVSMDCLKWNTRSVNQAFETRGLRSAIMDSLGSREADQFDAIRHKNGLGAALAHRAICAV